MDKSVSGQQNFRSNLVSLELNLALVPHHPLLDFGKKILPKKAIHSHNQVQGFVPILWSFFPKWDWLWSAHSTIPLLMAKKQSITQFAKVLEILYIYHIHDCESKLATLVMLLNTPWWNPSTPEWTPTFAYEAPRILWWTRQGAFFHHAKRTTYSEYLLVKQWKIQSESWEEVCCWE